MAITVTATPGGPSFQNGIDILVRVLTNATETGGASDGSRNTAAGIPQGSLTPNFSSSYIVFAISQDGVGTMGAAATNNTYDNNYNNGTQGWCTAAGHYTGTVTSGTALTYGAGASGTGGTGADHENWCAYEIPQAGGTVTVDGSSPAAVNNDTATTLTTASFTPPPGSVLVAMVTTGGTGSGAGITCSVSDTSGLHWTQRVTSSTADNFQPTFIFTATVPLSAPPPSVGRARPGRTWARRFRGLQPPWIAPPAPALPGPTGNAPGGAVVYRRPSRSVWGGVRAQPGQPLVSGTAPPHLVIGRRTVTRVLWRGPLPSSANVAPSSGPNGTVPPHLVVARRTAARAVWRGVVSTTTNRVYGPPPGGLIRRRSAARAIWHGNAGIAFPNGTVPPHLVIARRATARAVWRGTVSTTANRVYGPQPGGLIRRRAAARAVVRGIISTTTNAAPGTPGVGVPPPHLIVGRRTAARAYVRGVTSRTFNVPNGNTPGGLVRRRTPARAVWAGTPARTTNASAPALVNGTVPPHVVIGRRASTRVLWRGVTARTTNLPYGNQPGGLIRRRGPARGQWRGYVSVTASQSPGPGRTPKHLVVRRRKAARSYARWTAISTTNAPPPTFLVARSHATVTDPRDGIATVTAIATSRPTVTDPRDGTPGVT